MELSEKYAIYSLDVSFMGSNTKFTPSFNDDIYQHRILTRSKYQYEKYISLIENYKFIKI